MSHDPSEPERRDGHTVLRVKDGELETFDPYPLVEGEPVAIHQWRHKDDMKDQWTDSVVGAPTGIVSGIETRTLFTHPAVEGDGAREAGIREAIRVLGESLNSCKRHTAWYDRIPGLAFAVEELNVELEECALASQAPAPNRFDCEECGQGIGVDEDGCCRTCGRDAVIVEAPAQEKNDG